MRNRGLTLLEVMIALGLILALMTVALPAVLHRLPGAVWDETVTQLKASARHAAIDCRRAGKPLELVLREDATGRWVLEARPLLAVVEGALDAEDARVLTPAELAEAARVQEAMSVAAGGKNYLRLPSGYRMLRPSDEARTALAELPQAGETEEFGGEVEEAIDEALDGVLEGEEEGTTGDLTLAILMPDGTAITGSSVVMVGPEGRRAEIAVQPWSSELLVTEGVRAAADEETADEEDLTEEDLIEGGTGSREDDEEARVRRSGPPRSGAKEKGP